MTNDRRQPRNPLILDDDYEKLFDEDFVSKEDLEESDPEYDYLSYGSRRKKPMNYSDF